MSYDRDDVAEMLISKFPVYLDHTIPGLAVRRNRDDSTVASLYTYAITIIGLEIYDEPFLIQYDDPDFEDKLYKCMHLRLYGSEEDYLRFKRQEVVKRYFEQKKIESLIEKAWSEVPNWENYKP